MSATDFITLSEALSILRRDGPLSYVAPGEIGRIEDLFHEVIARETLGVRNVFDGTDDPDLGSVGRVRAVPVLSNKGAAIDALQKRFRKILALRDLLAARVDAERQMARLRPAGESTAPDKRAA